MRFCFIISIILHLGSCAGPHPNPYSYAWKDLWPQQYPEYCRGIAQSPINIDVGSSVPVDLPSLKFDNYLTYPVAENTTNNFHTLSTTGTFPATPTIRGGVMPYVYEFANLHFHWGSENTWGSEHRVNWYRFPLELHIVHKKKGVAMEDALKDKHGLAVLGVLYYLAPGDNKGLASLLSNIAQVRNGGVSAVREPVALKELLPNDLSSYFVYEGSLTTPLCNEAVIWTIFRNALPVSEAQLEKFRSLSDEAGYHLEDNFRSPQPLNGRVVYRTF